MTLRELGSGLGGWFHDVGGWFYDGWCKLIPKDLLNSSTATGQEFCPVHSYYGLGWLDLTIGQALFTILPTLFALLMFWELIAAMGEIIGEVRDWLGEKFGRKKK